MVQSWQCNVYHSDVSFESSHFGLSCPRRNKDTPRLRFAVNRGGSASLETNSPGTLGPTSSSESSASAAMTACGTCGPTSPSLSPSTAAATPSECEWEVTWSLKRTRKLAGASAASAFNSVSSSRLRFTPACTLELVSCITTVGGTLWLPVFVAALGRTAHLKTFC